MTRYTLSFEVRGTALHATVTGELTLETDAAIDARIRQECEGRGRSLLLVDIRRATSRLSYFDNHQAAKTFPDRMGPSIHAVAIVENAVYRENSEMYELTSVNRGATVKFFETPETAQEWLATFSQSASRTQSADA
jgi:hypothetical protein